MADIEYDLTYQDFNPTIFFASKMKMKTQTTYHAHSDFAELTYILSGQCRYHIAGQFYDLMEGDIIISNPGVYHQNILLKQEEPAVEFCTGFRDFQFRGMKENTIDLKELGPVLRLPSKSKREIRALCMAMLSENDKNQVGRYFMLKAQLIQILIILLREIVKKPDLPQTGYNFETFHKGYVVQQIIHYMMENYESKISLDQIAHNMYLSPVYVSKIFKEETKESPINYLIRIRLNKAAEILQSDHKISVKDVAGKIGYDDVYHFSKLFKKYFGISPQNYRKSSELRIE